jgi:hypothetical protein
MDYKTLQRRTDNNNGQKKMSKQWSTKHNKDVQTITMVKRKRANNDLQNTTKTYRQQQWSKEKGQTMIYKTLQRRTDNNNCQKKKGKQWSTKHYKDVQTITIVKRKRANNDLQNITN